MKTTNKPPFSQRCCGCGKRFPKSQLVHGYCDTNSDCKHEKNKQFLWPYLRNSFEFSRWGQFSEVYHGNRS